MAKQSEEYKRLSKHLTKQVSKANHRYDRMEKAGWKSPAMEVAKKTGGRFRNGRKMSYREMQRENKRVQNFLNSKTSSKSGTKKSVNKLLKATGLDKKFKTKDVMKNKKTLDKYFRVYKKMREYEQVKGIGRSYQSSMNAVTSTFESTGGSGSVDDTLDRVASSLNTSKNDDWDSDETFNHIIG
jgi:hypothetical protein